MTSAKTAQVQANSNKRRHEQSQDIEKKRETRIEVNSIQSQI
jgi:hypothetical protein